jgi:Ca-activated chloride channel family protein
MRKWAQWGLCAWAAVSALGCSPETGGTNDARGRTRSMTLRAEHSAAAAASRDAGSPEDPSCNVDDTAAPDGGEQQARAQLLAKDSDGKKHDLPLHSASYDSFVIGTVADTVVKQRYYNPFEHTIEAVYVFPLPHDGAVFDYSITVQGRRLRGEMKRRLEARAAYEAAKKDGRTAAMLEQERPNIFTQSVANIPPGETVEVELRVVQPLQRSNGRYTLALPTVVGPRHVSARVADGSRITPMPRLDGPPPCANVSIQVALESGSEVDDVRSKHHDIELRHEGSVAHVALTAGATVANRDFELSWSEASARERATLVVQPEPDVGGGYFTLTLEPPAVVARARPRELVFVIDASGSMSGQPIATAKATVRKVLERLAPNDVFQVVQFSHHASSLGAAFLPNTKDAVARGLRFVDAIRGEGGTEMLAGVRAALDMPRDPRRLRMVLFLTDGYIGNEAEIFREVRARLGDARLFSLGVGSAVNRHLLDGLARMGRGRVEYMTLGERPDAIVDRFYDRIDRPALTDVAIDWGGLRVEDVEPQQLPDLFAGAPVVVFGKYRGEPRGAIALRAQRDQATEHIAVDVDFARPGASSAALSTMWARSRIARLDDQLIEHPDGERADALREQQIALALAHHVMTEHTAFVAIDDARRASPGAQTVHVPVEIPSGLSAQMFGAASFSNFGGLGLSGTGRGGGGSADGTIGLGTIGSIGHGAGGGYGYGPTGQVAQITFETLEVRGAIAREVVRRILRRHQNELRFCYEQELHQTPSLQGTLLVELIVAHDGSVSSARVARSTLGSSKVEKCVVAAFQRWTFPAPGGEQDASITVPITLQPGSR